MVGCLGHENTKLQTRLRERVERGDATKLTEVSGILEGLWPVFNRIALLKVWLGDHWGSSIPFQEAL